MASHQTVLEYMGKALWEPKPTKSDKQARQLAEALGYPVGWRVVRTLEPVVTTAAAPVEDNWSSLARPDASMFVATPIGHRQLTRTPASPYVTDSHSAKAIAACFVTEYPAAPICVRSPAAEAVDTK